jgi:hypothetical protein
MIQLEETLVAEIEVERKIGEYIVRYRKRGSIVAEIDIL